MISLSLCLILQYCLRLNEVRGFLGPRLHAAQPSMCTAQNGFPSTMMCELESFVHCYLCTLSSVFKILFSWQFCLRWFLKVPLQVSYSYLRTFLLVVVVVFNRSVMSESFATIMGCSLAGFSVHGIPRQNIGVGCHFLLWVIFPTQGSDRTRISFLRDRFFTTEPPGHLENCKFSDPSSKLWLTGLGWNHLSNQFHSLSNNYIFVHFYHFACLQKYWN